MKSLFATALCVLLSFGSDAAYAADYPTSGQLYSREDDAGLFYGCYSGDDPVYPVKDRLTCDFRQTKVRKSDPAGELRAIIGADGRVRGIQPGTLGKMGCNFVRVWLALATGEMTADSIFEHMPEFAGLSAQLREGAGRIRQQGLEETEAFVRTRAEAGLCGAQTKAGLIGFLQERSRHLGTCYISTYHYKQSFKPATEADALGAWDAVDGIGAYCAGNRLVRLEKHPAAGSSDGWRLVRRTTAVEKTSGLRDTIYCTPSETVFEPQRSRDLKLDCKYVDFSPF